MRNCKWLTFLGLFSLFSVLVNAAQWYVDPELGEDGNTGAKTSPLKTLRAAMDKAAAGDEILLQPGSYKGIEHMASQPWRHLYRDDFVSISPAPGVRDSRHKITIERLRFGMRAGHLAGEGRRGRFDAWLRVTGVTILDGVYVFGYNHLRIEDCRVERYGPHVGSSEAIEKFAVNFACGEDLTLRDCEITRTAGGVVLSARGGRIVGNTIHDITHDGIRCISSKQCLVEGNRIYNLDDGVNDGDPAAEGWNRNCDAIHIFVPGPGLAGARNSDLTIRGNVIYNCESQGIQFNNYLRVNNVWNQNVVIENNIFGPARGNVVNVADPVDGLVFRHNTFLYFPDGVTFDGRGRTVECANHALTISSRCRNAHIYNNILFNSVSPQPDWFVGYNVIVGDRGLPTRFDRFNVDPKFAEPESFDGRLATDSPAANAGTRRFAPTPIPSTDIHGTGRDVRPDCGAYELPGQNPPPESPAPQTEEPVITFIDDFKDASLAADPWLNGPGQAGLSWSPPPDQASWVIRSNGEECWLTAVGRAGESWMLANEGGDWSSVKVESRIRNTGNRTRTGVLLRANADLEGYLVDLARGQVLRRVKQDDGDVAEIVLATARGFLPSDGEREFIFAIEDSHRGTRITLDVDADGTVDLQALDDTDPPVEAGTIALVSDSPNSWQSTDWLEFEVKLGK